ncbi:MAG TPA: hypothetical protein VKS01_06075 [Bryobacteraceae bacterium]|nr:hypothetical protein [Bryobacteraceae bacterium]
MTLFDLLFLAVFLATLVALIAAAVFSIRGDNARAGRTALGVAVFLGIYLAIVLGVSLATPRRYVNLGERHCYDDWCVTVVEATAGSPFTVKLKVSSDAKRIRQSAPDTKVFLEDSTGKRYTGRIGPGQPGFGTMIGPGEWFETVHEFDVPAGVRVEGLVLAHGTGPGLFVIGEDAALLHPRMLYKLN